MESPTVEDVLDEAEVTEVAASTKIEPVLEPKIVDAETTLDEPACESTPNEEQQQDPPITDTVVDAPKDEPEVEHVDTVEVLPVEPTGDEADPSDQPDLSDPVVVVTNPEVS